MYVNSCYIKFLNSTKNVDLSNCFTFGAEQKIGKWNGFDLYQKVVTYTNSSSIGNTSAYVDIDIPHGISNFRQIVDIQCVMSTGGVIPLTASNGGSTCIPQVTNTNIVLRIYKDTWSARTWYFTMRYVK